LMIMMMIDVCGVENGRKWTRKWAVGRRR